MTTAAITVEAATTALMNVGQGLESAAKTACAFQKACAFHALNKTAADAVKIGSAVVAGLAFVGGVYFTATTIQTKKANAAEALAEALAELVPPPVAPPVVAALKAEALAALAEAEAVAPVELSRLAKVSQGIQDFMARFVASVTAWGSYGRSQAKKGFDSAYGKVQEGLQAGRDLVSWSWSKVPSVSFPKIPNPFA